MENDYKYELGMGCKGNGTVIWDRLHEVGGDYETIAQVDEIGEIHIRKKNMPPEMTTEIKALTESLSKQTMINVLEDRTITLSMNPGDIGMSDKPGYPHENETIYVSKEHTIHGTCYKVVPVWDNSQCKPIFFSTIDDTQKFLNIMREKYHNTKIVQKAYTKRNDLQFKSKYEIERLQAKLKEYSGLEHKQFIPEYEKKFKDIECFGFEYYSSGEVRALQVLDCRGELSARQVFDKFGYTLEIEEYNNGLLTESRRYKDVGKGGEYPAIIGLKKYEKTCIGTYDLVLDIKAMADAHHPAPQITEAKIIEFDHTGEFSKGRYYKIDHENIILTERKTSKYGKETITETRWYTNDQQTQYHIENLGDLLNEGKTHIKQLEHATAKKTADKDKSKSKDLGISI
jgi:hypothetical protein